MKFYVSVILAIFLPISQTNADSWTYKRGRYYTSHGVYCTLPTNSSNTHLLNFKYSYPSTSQMSPFNQQIAGATLSFLVQEKLSNSKVIYPFELQYGLRDNLTVFTKMDLGHMREKFTLSVIDHQNDAVEKIFFPTGYYSLESNIGFRKRLFYDNNSVLSTAWALFPGELRFYKNSSGALTSTTAIEGELLYGRNFKQSYLSTTHSNYLEWRFASKYYYQQRHFQFGIGFQFGLRPNADWLVVFGVNNTFSKLNYVKRNIPDIELFFKDSGVFPNKATQNDIKKFLSKINEEINPFRKAISYSKSHQFNFKTAYFLNQNSSIGLEHFLLISQLTPFINYTIMLKFEKYF